MKKGKAVSVEQVGCFRGHKEAVFALAQAPGHTFFSSGADGLVARWDLDQPDKGELVAKLEGTVYCFLYLPEHNWAIVAENYFGVRYLDLSTMKEFKAVQLTDQAIYAMETFKGDLVVGDANGKLYVLELATGTLKTVKQVAEKSVRCLAENPKGNALAVGTSDEKVLIYDDLSQSPQHVLDSHQGSVFCLAFDQQQPYLITGGRDAHFKVWDTATYKELEDVPAHLFTINHLTFRKDQKYFATASMDKTIKIWSAETYRLVKVIDRARHQGHSSSVNKLLWLDHEDLLVSVSDDKQVLVWKLGLD